jgi:hypothetical protein
MKKVILPLPAYNNKVDAFTAAGNLRRKVSTCTAAVNLLLPSSKGRRKEFTLIATGATSPTVIATSPDTLVGAGIVSPGTAGTYRAISGKWYRVS